MKNILRKLFLLLIVPTLITAQIGLLNPYNIADITGTGVTVSLASVSTVAKIVKLTAPVGNAAVIRYGDSTTSISRGDILSAGTKDSFSAINGTYLDLHNMYAYIANGDKLIVSYWYGN